MAPLVSEVVLNRAASVMAPQSFTRNYSQQQETGSLPRLPVPPLQLTLQRYLRSVKPLVTGEEYKVTQELANKFAVPGGLGEKLQKLLEAKAATTESWLADWWLNSAYLDFRLPVVVYSNPGLVFPFRRFSNTSDQLAHAAKLISAALDFKTKLDGNKLPTEKMGPYVLDMSQYYKVLGTCRIPGITRDSLRLPDSKNPSRHIVVAHNNHFFAVSVYGEQGEPLNQSQLLAQLNDCIARSTHPAAPVGILTSENRNVWGKAYQALKKDKSNAVSLDMIERSLFLVCLDGEPGEAEKTAANKMTAAALKLVHGGGSKSNSANRWFDKTIQFVFGPNGEVGLTYEHSPAEGQPIAVLMDHIENYCDKHGNTNSLMPALKFDRPQRLPFTVPSDIEEVIHTAQANLDNLVDDLEMHCISFTGYGKEFIKTLKLSPDSYIQMAIQFAFYRLHNEPGAHYESASTRRFLHGRTETIRSCSIESAQFAQTMLNKNANDQDKAAALRMAIKSHKDYATNALAGEGVDRHLLGLRLIAIENGMDVPKLFLDTGYTRSSHMRLSTSQVAARCRSFMCYGPLVPDGYGCCYNPRADEIVFGTSAFNSNPDTSAVKFCAALEQSLYEMQAVMARVPPPAKL
ncbi:hypothetical protein B566_EDAN011336 [Ephemera danica]|nr:hypothetical protein B566_EDAN011336 [Ephemera danica]